MWKFGGSKCEPQSVDLLQLWQACADFREVVWCFWMCLDQFRRVWKCLDAFGCVPMHPDMFERLRMFENIFERVGILFFPFSGIFECPRTFSNLLRCFWTV